VSCVSVLKHRFVITGCDEYVWKMIQLMGDHIPVTTIESIRKVHGNKKKKEPEMCNCQAEEVEQEVQDEKWKKEGENYINNKMQIADKKEEMEKKYEEVDKVHDQRAVEGILRDSAKGDGDVNVGVKKTVRFKDS